MFNQVKGKGFREGFNKLDENVEHHGRTNVQLINSNFSDLSRNIKDLKENNYNMSAILDIQTYANSIVNWAKKLEKEVEA
jgi:hypothetical protein